MDRLLKSRLYDIATAIDEIYSFFEQIPMLKEEATALLTADNSPK